MVYHILSCLEPFHNVNRQTIYVAIIIMDCSIEQLHIAVFSIVRITY